MSAALSERSYPTDFFEELIPLDDYRQTLGEFEFGGAEASQALDDLRERGFEVVAGVREKDVAAITAIAGQETVKRMCPKDLSKRFGDPEMMGAWLKKGNDGKVGRGMFLLRDAVDLSLMGYGWTGPETCKELPEQTHTFAVRVGEQAQGKRLATPFTRAIVMGSIAIFGGQNTGLETWSFNAPAVNSYLRAGAQKVRSKYDQTVGADRFFMYFPDTFPGGKLPKPSCLTWR